jgi:inosose dehydratase
MNPIGRKSADFSAPFSTTRAFMKIATAPVNWNSPHVPEYRPVTPYPQLLDEMKSAGYTATEWSVDMPKNPNELARDLRARGLEMLGGYVELELRTADKRVQEVQRGIEIGKFFKSLGGSYLIAADGGDARRIQEAGHVNPEGGLTDLQWSSLCKGLNELGAALQPIGVSLVFHNHVGTYVETEAEVSRLLDGTDPAAVQWCLDCGHLAYGGGDTLRMVEKYGQRVGYFHVKDVDSGVLRKAHEQEWSFLTALKKFIFTPLGEGLVNIPAVIGALKHHHYDGWVVIEQDTTPLDVTVNARVNRLYLEKLLQSLG